MHSQTYKIHSHWVSIFIWLSFPFVKVLASFAFFLSNLCCAVSVSVDPASTTYSFLSLLGWQLCAVAPFRNENALYTVRGKSKRWISTFYIYMRILCAAGFCSVINMYCWRTRHGTSIEKFGSTTRSHKCVSTHTIHSWAKCWTRNIIIASHHIDEAPNTLRSPCFMRNTPTRDCMCLLCMYFDGRRRCCCRCSAVKSHDKWQKRRLDSTHARAWLRFNIYRDTYTKS